jgi:hypothetical protein
MESRHANARLGEVETATRQSRGSGSAPLNDGRRSVAEEATLEHGFREGNRSRRAVVEKEIRDRLRHRRDEHLNHVILKLKLESANRGVRFCRRWCGFDLAAIAGFSRLRIPWIRFSATMIGLVVDRRGRRLHHSQGAMIREEQPGHQQQRDGRAAEDQRMVQGSHNKDKVLRKLCRSSFTFDN